VHTHLIFFKGTIDGGKMYQQIQYNTDFDKTLQLYNKRVVFETYRVTNASEKKKDIEDKGNKFFIDIENKTFGEYEVDILPRFSEWRNTK